MMWIDKLKEWREKGFTYPKHINYQFLFETSPIINSSSIYEEEFIRENRLNNEQNYKSFSYYINKSDDKNVVVFKILGGTSTLIIPMPRDKDFSTIKNFTDNADENQKKYFWRKVADEIEKNIMKNEIFWVSTHGLGVPYFHLRIDNKPKYYKTKKFMPFVV